ncbi:MAG: putative binding protein YgiS [Chloroflexi bacterium]|nr:putative binding protein YgiS [Chloroflexota bacterium]
MKNKAVLFLVLAAIIVPLRPAVAATKLPPNAAPQAQQILRLPNTGPEGPYLDETLTIYNRQDGTDLIQEPLVVTDARGNVFPTAATSWSVSPDKLTWTFHIRKGLVWSDGVPLTAKDYLFSFRNQASPKTAYDFTFITEAVQDVKNWAAVNTGKMPLTALGVAAPDLYTLTITTAAPRPQLPATIAYVWAEPEHVVSKYGNNWATSLTHMVFSGPYIASSWQKGVSITLTPNSTYHGVRKAPFSKITWAIAAGNGMAQFQTGQVDQTPYLGAGQLQAALHSSQSKDVVTQSAFDVWYLTYNTYTKPFSDLRVRQAFNLAVDRQTLANDVLKNIAIPNYTLLMPGYPGYDKSIKVPYSVKQAQQLLAAAGYAGGKGFPSINIYVRNSPGEIGFSVPAAEYIQSQLKTNLGVNVGVKVLEQKVVTADLNQHTAPLVLIGYNYDYVGTSNFMDLFVTGGRHAWSNKQYDQTVAAADSSFDATSSKALYAKAQHILADQVPASFLFTPVYHFLWNPKIANPPTLPQLTDDWMLNSYVMK